MSCVVKVDCPSADSLYLCVFLSKISDKKENVEAIQENFDARNQNTSERII